MIILLLILLFSHPSYAGQVKFDGQVVVFDDKYSQKDFTGWDLSGRKDMDGITIYGSNFSQETPDAITLPANLSGATFLNCNLDNVFIPPGNVVTGGSQKRFKAQNDLADWIVDSHNVPIEPINKEKFNELGLSVDPADIPAQKAKENIIFEKEKILAQTKALAIEAIENP